MSAFQNEIQASTHAPIYANSQIYIDAPPKRVWDVLTDINAWPNWHKGIRYAKLSAPLGEDVTFRWKLNWMPIGSRIVMVHRHQSIGWMGISMNIITKNRWVLTPQKKGTFLQVEEYWDGRMASIVKLLRPKMLDNILKVWLELLKRAVEASSLEGTGTT
jgi:uncharacterized membrane protein